MAIESAQPAEDEQPLGPKASDEDRAAEVTLRPQLLSEYVGQPQLKENLHILIGAAKMRGEPLEHLLLHGPPGLGKTTLAHIIAREVGAGIRVTSGPAIERAGDLASLLTNLSEGDVLFIDEIHRLSKIVEEVLYPAMEDGVLDIVLGKGPGARSIRMELPRFTLIGATTRLGLIAAPLRDRFGASFRLEYYGQEELEEILRRSGRILGTTLEAPATSELAQRARFTPRIANRLLRRARDFAEVHGGGTITHDVASRALALLEVDALGLDRTDRRVLEALVGKFSGGPVGLSTLAAATGEEEDTITDVIEPFLIRQGLLARTPKGRVSLEATYRHLGLVPPQNLATEGGPIQQRII